MLHETSIRLLADLVTQVVQVESPVHCVEVVGQDTQRILFAESRGLNSICGGSGDRPRCRPQGVHKEGRFLSVPEGTLEVRDRGNVSSPGLRKPQNISPAELAVGVERIVTDDLGAMRDEVVVALARLLGFKSTSAQMRNAVTDVVDTMLADGRLMEVDGLLQMQ